VTFSNHARGEARAQVGALDDGTSAPRDGSGRAGVLLPGRAGERRAAGAWSSRATPVHRQAVGAWFGRDLELEHLRGDRQHVSQRGARRDSASGVRSSSTRMPLAVALESIPSSLSARIIPSEGTPRSSRSCSSPAVGHDRSRACDGDRLPGGDGSGRRTRCWRERAVVAEVDLADLQPVGVRVLLDTEHAADDEALERRDAVVVDRLDLRAGHRKALLDAVDVQVGVAVVAQPAQRDEHQNCSRKRRSLCRAGAGLGPRA